VQGIDAIQHLTAQPWPVDHLRLRGQATAQGVPFDATFQSTMLGTYALMPAAVAAGVEQVSMAGSTCALGHGYRISQTPFPCQVLPIDESYPAFPDDSYGTSMDYQGITRFFTFHRIMWWSPGSLRDPLALGQSYPHLGSSVATTT
jgi:nucleoside-diphosphate-sugar epimerase